MLYGVGRFFGRPASSPDRASPASLQIGSNSAVAGHPRYFYLRPASEQEITATGRTGSWKPDRVREPPRL